jgi:hypothetical protein
VGRADRLDVLELQPFAAAGAQRAVDRVVLEHEQRVEQALAGTACQALNVGEWCVLDIPQLQLLALQRPEPFARGLVRWRLHHDR